MFEVFEKYLRESVDLSNEDLISIRTACTTKNLNKWQSLLHDGEVCKNMFFIASGCFRLYRYDNEGTDHTVRFGIENWWITDQESYNTGNPSNYNIEALAKSIVIVWPKASWDELLATIPSFKIFYEQLVAKAFETSQQRIYSLISSPAEARYLEFLKTYPKIFNKVPLHMVASYLGISRETLSRVRRDILRPIKSPLM